MECNCNNNNSNGGVIPWVRGNRLPLIICVYEDVVTQAQVGDSTLTVNEMTRVPYTIQSDDTVTVMMKSGFRQEEMPFTTDGNKVMVTDNGELPTGTYTVEVTIVRGDGARGRWQETRQVRIYENTSEAQLGEMYSIDADLFFYAKGDTGTGIADITNNPDGTLTITMTDGTSYVTEALKGDKGDKGDTGERGVSIVAFDVTGQTDVSVIYTVTFSDDTTQDISVPKGPQGDTGLTGNGISSTTLNSNYTLTIAYTDGTTYTTPSIRGPQGAQGVSVIGFTQTGETATNTMYNLVFSDGRTQSVAIPKGVKGDRGDKGDKGDQGIQGPMGDVAVITPEQQAAFTMYSVTGQHDDGPMTQKAVTDNFAEIGNSGNNADLDFADDYGIVVMRLSEGHVKTKNFDSRNFKTFVADEDNTDIDFADEQDNVVLRVSGGHVKTKEFDSSLVDLKTGVSNNSDLDFSDINGKVLARFRNGHIQTKNFNSADLESIVSGMYQTILAKNHPLHGKKVGFLGDSITYGYGLPENVRLSKRYSSVLCSMVGCAEVNLGVSGSTIASNTINNLNDQRFVTRVTQTNIGDLDFLFVFGGTNDFSYDSKPIGEHFSVNAITTSSDYIGNTQLGAIADTDTFAGGLHDLILAIRAINQDLPMCFITPLNRGRYLNGGIYNHGGITYAGARPNTADSNSQGNYLHEFVDAIIDITRFYAIPSIDMGSLFNNDPSDDGGSSLFIANGDNLHPNVAGHLRFAKLLFNWTLNNIII